MQKNLHNSIDPSAVSLPHSPKSRLSSNVPQLMVKVNTCIDGSNFVSKKELAINLTL